MLQVLYSRTLALAASRHAMWTMAAISFAESSFLPLPPDFLLIPMTLAQPRRVWFIAAVCTIASVLGGFVGMRSAISCSTRSSASARFKHAMDKYEALKGGFAQ